MNRDRTTDRSSPPARRRRWPGVVVVLVALVVLAAIFIQLGRDTPRRWLEGRLAAMLDAEVRLGRLEIDNLHHFVLHDIEVRQVRWESRLGRLSIERLDVEASVRQALAGRYERLAAEGVEVWLVPAARPAEPPPESEVQVREIEIRRARLVVASGTGETEMEFAATLGDWGNDPTGRVSLTAERFDLAPLLGVLQPEAFPEARATAEMLDIKAYLEGGAEPFRVEAGARSLLLSYRERTVELHQPRLEATAAIDDGRNVVLLKLDPTIPGVEAAAVEAELDRESYALLSGRAELRGMEIATLLEEGAALPDGWSVDGRADLSLRTDDGNSFAYDLGAGLIRIAFPMDEAAFRGEDITATVRGTWHRSPETSDATALDYGIDAMLGTLGIENGPTELAATGSRFACSGRLDTTGSGEIDARMTLANGRGRYGTMPLPTDLFPVDGSLDGMLTLGETVGFEGVTELFSSAAGRLQARGTTVLEPGRPFLRWRWDWSEAPDLDALRRTATELGFELAQLEVSVRGRPSARGEIEGSLTDPAVQGQLTIEDLELASTAEAPLPGVGKWKLERGRASIRFSRGTGDRGRIGFDQMEIDGSASLAPAESWTSPLAITGTGWADARLGELQLDDGRIDIQRLGMMQVEGRLEPDRSLSLTARLEPAELSRIRELSHLWIEDPAPDYAVQGTVASRLDVQRTSEGLWQTRGELDLNGAGMGSGDGAHVLEGAGAHFEVGLSMGPGSAIAGGATAILTGPVILWGTLFGDFSNLSSDLELKVHRDGGGWESTADWRLPHGVEAHGRLAAQRGPGLVDYAVSVDVTDLSAFLGNYVRAPFEGSVEHIDTLEAAGHLRIDLFGAADESQRNVEGSVTALDTSFSGVDGTTRIEGLMLDLPISLRWKTESDGTHILVPGVERSGSLRFERLWLGGLEFPPLDTLLTVESDTVRLDRPLSLAVFDGKIELQGISLAEWSRPERDLRLSMRLDELSLAALTSSLGAYPLEGSLSGTFPSVRLTPDRLQVDGGGAIQIFGGEVAIYDISGRDVLSRFPKLQFSARLDDVHLLDVTRTFDFGEIYGVVNGEIKECELFGGTPVRCEAALASVKTKGVPQKISVKAIHNISILGAGPQIGILDRGLQKFFDTYTYSRLGFTMKLDNDRFLLRGTEHRGQSELFVKGRLPLSIDIVNAAPGQTVSFQTMISRLRNLQVAPPVKKGRKPATAP